MVHQQDGRAGRPGEFLLQLGVESVGAQDAARVDRGRGEHGDVDRVVGDGAPGRGSREAAGLVLVDAADRDQFDVLTLDGGLDDRRGVADDRAARLQHPGEGSDRGPGVERDRGRRRRAGRGTLRRWSASHRCR